MNIITCPYCSSELKVVPNGDYKNHASCSFCGNILFGEHSGWGMYSSNGKRKSKVMKEMVFIQDAEKPLSELVNYHTHDLLVCLRLVRLERTKAYDLLRTFNKAFDCLPEEDSKQFEDTAQESGGMYEYWTRRMWMLENLLMDRMGYFPKRIDDSMLIRIKEQSLKAQNRVMAISRERRTIS